MSQFDTNYEIDEDDDDQGEDRIVTLKRSDIRKMEAAAKRGNKATALERENALLKAGVDFDSPIGNMFAKGYDGELTKEAIRAAAAAIPGALGGTPAPADTESSTPPEATATEEERTATAERAALANGASPDDQSHQDVRRTAFERSQEALKKGASEDDALGSYFNTLATSAAQGNQDVVVK